MKKILSFLGTFSLLITIAYAQNVGIGTTTPASKLHVSGTANNPAIPGNASTGIFRIGINTNEGIDFGKMGAPSYAGWIQAGVNGTSTHPLTLQPVGGNVGIGTTTPTIKLDILSPSQTGLRILSGAINSNTSLEIGGISTNGTIGIAGINGDYSLGSQAGDVIIRTEDLSHRLILNNGAGNPALTIFNGNVGIGTVTPASSAKVEINSTSQGFLPPRMTIAQRNLITNPAIGLVIFCTDCDELQFFNGIIWKNMAGTIACEQAGPVSVTICNTTWMLTNLDVGTYKNGDPIPQVTDQTAWKNLTTGAWCWYNNDSVTNSIYGKLYNWYAVTDPRGLAPQGWHVPSDAEWATLVNCLGGEWIAGSKMREVGTTHWINQPGATNSSSFTCLPGGYRFIDYFDNLGRNGIFWTITGVGTWSAVSYSIISQNCYSTNVALAYGLSVRCVRDW